MRKRIEQERGSSGQLQLRFSPGGLTDFEFIATWTQLRLGPADPALRTTKPLRAIEQVVK